MFKKIGLLAACACSATALHAGGLERTTQSPAILFEDGRYMELNFGYGMPDVSGVGALVTPGASSGNMTENFLNFGFAYKADLNDTFSYALIYDQPYGAKVNYPGTFGVDPYFAAGSSAEFKSHALTGILQYNMDNNISVYGGLRAQTIEAEAVVPFLGAYSAQGDRDFALGYLVGASFEKPEIALRVALTYLSAIDHSLTTTENSALGAGRVSNTDITMPQAVNLEFQSGVAEDTLVFGSVRWVEWSEADITPSDYFTVSGGGSLVSFADDRTTFTLGVGRRLNETWSVAGSVSHERTTGSPTGNLGPTDGFTSLGLAAVYSKDNMKVTTGVRYVDVGKANTRVGAAVPGAIFRDNSAIGVGVKVGWQF